jgi:hypothetical protein
MAHQYWVRFTDHQLSSLGFKAVQLHYEFQFAILSQAFSFKEGLAVFLNQ